MRTASFFALLANVHMLCAPTCADTQLLEQAPEILVQPSDVTVRKGRTLEGGALLAGDSVILTVGATGFPTPSYQWRRNGENLAGQIAPLLYIHNPGDGHSGSYDVVVQNREGRAVSQPATVSVVENAGKVEILKPGDDLAGVIRNLQAGETVLFRGGQYDLSERRNIILKEKKKTGKSWAKPLTLAAYPGEQPVFDGTFVIAHGRKWKKHSGDIYMLDLKDAGVPKPDSSEMERRMRLGRSTSYFEGLWMDGPPGQGQSLRHQIALNRQTAERWYPDDALDNREGIYGAGITQVDQPGEFAYDHDKHRLYVWLPGNGNPNQHEFRALFFPLEDGELSTKGSRGMWFEGGHQYLIFRGLTFRGTAGTPLYVRRSDHIVLEDMDLSYSSGQLRCQGDDYTAINCHLHHGNYNGIQISNDEGVRGFRFLKNHVHHFGDPATWGHAILGAECWGMNLSGTDRAIIYGNYFHHNYHGLDRLKGGAIVHETWGKEYPLRAPRQTIFENNIFAENCDDLHFQGKKETRLEGSIIRNNLFYHPKRRAVTMFGDNRMHTIHSNAVYDSKAGSMVLFQAVSDVAPSENKVFNNRMIKSDDSYKLRIRAAEGNTVLNNRFEDGTYSLDELIRQLGLTL